ncbi:MAG: pyrroline-5-carboxylate reductase [Pseudomonadota bacterium]
MNTPTIAFIGAGNMACSIVGGLVAHGHPASAMHAADPVAASLDRLRNIAEVEIHADNSSAAAEADIVILSVKPQVIDIAASSIADTVRDTGSLVMSIAAGISIHKLQSRIGEHAAIVRCMPNTPALLRCGATGLFANEHASAEQREMAEYVLSAIGHTHWVAEESQLDAVTALSGSGPAYFFLFTEAMIDAACEQGLDRAVATELALQTAYGAARMALENDVDLVELRRRVTSPGGTTERAVESFEQDELRQVVARAIRAATERAVEMEQELD